VRTVRHPAVWTILYLPFGAMSGFVSVALTYLATRHGLTITEAAFLPAASMISQWLKWLWAPAVDVTLSPRRWYLIGTGSSAVGVFALAAVPMSQDTLPVLLAMIATTSLLRTFVGMSLEAMVAATTPPHDQGRTSAWFQVGNLGGAGLGGGLGLTLLEVLPSPWMAGAILAGLFLLCGLALLAVPPIHAHRVAGGPAAAVRSVIHDVAQLARTKGGLLVTVLCFLPLGTGAAKDVLTQAAIAERWHATAAHVALVQGYLSAGVTAAGCFAGGWMATRMGPRRAYVVVVLALAAAAVAIAAGPATATTYVVGNMLYAFVYGLTFAAWTAVVLAAMGTRSAATKYNLFASLSNFPTWWLGLLLGYVADRDGAVVMLWAEGLIGVGAVLVFILAARLIGRTRLADELVE
jgi:MFS family permease